MLPSVSLRALPLALAGLLVILAGCSQPTDPATGPFVYDQKYSGNVSALYGPTGAMRSSASDSYAPQFYWRRSDGSLDSITGHKGRIVILNFWATWCVYCKNEMPDLQTIANDLKDTVDVIGVSVDYGGNVFQYVKDFVNANNYRYQFVVDSAFTVFGKYLIDKTKPIPQTFIMDQNGDLRYSFEGQQNKATFESYIRKLE